MPAPAPPWSRPPSSWERRHVGRGADIDLGPLDQRSYVYAADGSLITTLQADVDRQPVPLSMIPQHTVDAVLAVEDADFYAHDGVNLRATLRALVRNVDEGDTSRAGPRSPSRS